MRYGYCRISTQTQNIERQVRNILAAYPDARIFQEVYSGTTFQGREQMEKLLKRVKQGDTIIFDSVSRMSRSADEGFALYEALYQKGINLVFLKEPHINTDTYRKALSAKVGLTGDKVDCILEGVNKHLTELAKEQIQIAFAQAEKEVTDLHQRTKEGLLTAKLNGQQVGRAKGSSYETRKAKAAKKIIATHSKAFGGALNDRECIRLTGLSRNTYYKYKREIRDGV